MDDRPLIAITLGDVAGVGPEIALRAWGDPALHSVARPFVVGQNALLRWARVRMGARPEVVPITDPAEAAPTPRVLPCLDGSGVPLDGVVPGRVDAWAGRAAYDFLNTAIDLALARRIDAIATLPIQKEALHAAGVAHPGHTEILAERCGVRDFAMMLYLPPPHGGGRAGLGVLHTTLHVALREVFDLISTERVLATIRLANEAFLPLLDGVTPRVAVAGLNPHAGEGGLFGHEETRIIAPAVELAANEGIVVSGPIAADTLFSRAIGGEFDAVVAMYHDQGHCAIKTVGFHHAVNVTLGLPIVRTSVAHGTAFDIAWQGRADTRSLIAAVSAAARIVEGRSRMASGV